MLNVVRERESPREDETEISADTVAILQFELMKQIITMSLALAGGTATMLQLLIEDMPSRRIGFAGIFLLVLAALLALVVQEYLVERLGEQTKTMRQAFFIPKKFRAPRTPRVERMYFLGSVLSFTGGLILVVLAVSGLL